MQVTIIPAPLIQFAKTGALTFAMVAIAACSSGGGGSGTPSGSSSSSSSASSAASSSSSSSSSSASSSSSTTSTSSGFIGNPVAGKSLWAQKGCDACHDNRDDGTFGSSVGGDFNINDLQAVTDPSETTLAQYIAANMPQGNPAHCVDACATDTAAFLWAYRVDNLIPNGGGEAGSISPWLGNGATVALDSAAAYEGNNSILITDRSTVFHAPEVHLKDLPGFTAGNSYVFSAAAQMAQGAGSATLNLRMHHDDLQPTLDSITATETGWGNLTGIFTVPETPPVTELTTFKVYINSPNTTASYRVDNLVAVLFDAPAIESARLDGGAEGDFAGWGNWGNVTATQSEADAHTGTKSVLVAGRTITHDSPAILLTDLILPGNYYEVSVYAKLASGEADAVLQLIRNVDYVSRADQHIPVTEATVTDDGWVKLKGSFAYLPANEEHTVSLHIDAPPSVTSFYLDDFSIRGVAAP